MDLQVSAKSAIGKRKDYALLALPIKIVKSRDKVSDWKNFPVKNIIQKFLKS